MVVYDVPGHTLVEMIDSRTATALTEEEVADSLYERYLQPAYSLYGVKYRKQVRNGMQDSCTFPGFRVLIAGSRRLVVVDSILPEICPKKKIKTDYLLLSHNPRVDIRQLEQIFCVGTYIFDASSSLWNIRRWKSDCYMLTLRFFSVPDQGAYVVNF
jgi:competence protein ComEC